MPLDCLEGSELWHKLFFSKYNSAAELEGLDKKQKMMAYICR